jgi:hypothetical protein
MIGSKDLRDSGEHKLEDAKYNSRHSWATDGRLVKNISQGKVS